MDNWNSETMHRPETEEYQYLKEIKELCLITKDIDKIVNDWYEFEHFHIQCDSEKYKLNTKELKEKFLKLKNEIKEL